MALDCSDDKATDIIKNNEVLRGIFSSCYIHHYDSTG
jgi:hypothetical protein